VKEHLVGSLRQTEAPCIYAGTGKICRYIEHGNPESCWPLHVESGGTLLLSTATSVTVMENGMSMLTSAMHLNISHERSAAAPGNFGHVTAPTKTGIKPSLPEQDHRWCVHDPRAIIWEEVMMTKNNRVTQFGNAMIMSKLV
jgi:hypothetical protein